MKGAIRRRLTVRKLFQTCEITSRKKERNDTGII